MHGIFNLLAVLWDLLWVKISRAIDQAIKLKCPFMIISKSGGARMMEAGFSLMQMAKAIRNWDYFLKTNCLISLI